MSDLQQRCYDAAGGTLIYEELEALVVDCAAELARLTKELDDVSEVSRDTGERASLYASELVRYDEIITRLRNEREELRERAEANAKELEEHRAYGIRMAQHYQESNARAEATAKENEELRANQFPTLGLPDEELRDELLREGMAEFEELRARAEANAKENEELRANFEELFKRSALVFEQEHARAEANAKDAELWRAWAKHQEGCCDCGTAGQCAEGGRLRDATRQQQPATPEAR